MKITCLDNWAPEHQHTIISPYIITAAQYHNKYFLSISIVVNYYKLYNDKNNKSVVNKWRKGVCRYQICDFWFFISGGREGEA